ncbi:hypothetical protein AYO39_01985 [Actinobacteria bacterium SCGC AG-212-D09]|nr:hypothetical protein AYO39_01985 [Actinobacteria bacterium SCGC AG-212-D09]
MRSKLRKETSLAKVKTAPPEQVRASYEQHDRLTSNPASRGLFESNPPSLDEPQREVLDGLSIDGFAIMPVAKLFSDEVWEELARDAAGYRREIESQLDSGTAAAAPRPWTRVRARSSLVSKGGKEKFFMGRRYKRTPLTLDSPWLALAASERMLDVVNSYLGMWSKLSYVDQWYTPPRGSEADRLGSMRWHRDYNDQHLVKVFVYLVDVDEGTGPFEYVPGSARGGPYADLWPWQPAGDTYPAQDEFAQHVPMSAVRTFTAPAGSMIFCNTSGFHRGGFATEKPRDIFVFNYVSPAGLEALVSRNFQLKRSSVAQLAEAQRFALTE